MRNRRSIEFAEAVYDGVNSTIFAYGQTGSGKTHSIFGPFFDSGSEVLEPATIHTAPERGVIPRFLAKLFATAGGSRDRFTFYVSLMQIYNERLFDLLQDEEAKRPLNIREDSHGVFVEGISEYVVESAEDAIALVLRGNKSRKTRQTRMNMKSSRSHTIMQILVESNVVNAKGYLSKGKVNICDLAGSEKIKVCEAALENDHLEELKRINHSLSTLGKVIACLSGGKTGVHVPYREAKLTRLLQDSLGVNTRTYLIATVSPGMDCVEETISTLKFASCARKVQICVKSNGINATDQFILRRLKQEVEFLKALLYKGNHPKSLQEMHQQLLSLQAENAQLKSATTFEEIEGLRQENKQLRLELQKHSGQSAELFSLPRELGSRAQTTEATLRPTRIDFSAGDSAPSLSSGTPSSRIDVVRSKGHEVVARLASSDAVITLEGQLPADFGMVPIDGIRKMLEQRKWEQMSQQAAAMQEKLVGKGRCPVCTLAIPCRHYKSIEEAMRKLLAGRERKNPGTQEVLQLNQTVVSPSLQSQPESLNATHHAVPIQDLNCTCTGPAVAPTIVPRSRRSLRPPRCVVGKETVVRIRTRENGVRKLSGPILESRKERENVRKQSMDARKAEEKLRVLEKIELYRERQLQLTMDRMEEEKRRYDEDHKKEKDRVRLQMLNRDRRRRDRSTWPSRGRGWKSTGSRRQKKRNLSSRTRRRRRRED